VKHTKTFSSTNNCTNAAVHETDDEDVNLLLLLHSCLFANRETTQQC